MNRLVNVCVTACLLAAAAVTSAATATLDDVKKRGMLNCGANGQLPGFGLPDSQGNWTGLDVDLCRAIAAAVFNDANKVKFVALTAKDRFTALQSGDVDVLARNTTWTLSRDTQLGLNAAAVNYYDGQGFIIRKDLKVNSALELNDATICVQQGTTTELNLADYFRTNKMRLKTVTFLQLEEAVNAYETGRCNAFTTDASGLYSVRLKLSKPDDHVVLPEIISKEPLGPAVRQDDAQWFAAVRWAHFALVSAEELGVTESNAEQMATSSNPAIRRLLGTEGEFGKALGLDSDFASRMVKAHGNYGEIFERNLGTGSRLRIDRGPNKLWSDGGLQYAPPIR